ncbi:MAG: AAA family ATPase [Candidatus Binatia bacterium]
MSLATYPPTGADSFTESSANPVGTALDMESTLIDESALGAVATARRANQSRDGSTGYYPRKPSTLEEAGLTREFVERLICRFLLVHGAASGRRIGRETGLPFRAVEPLLAALKTDMLLSYRKTAAAGDYEYVLTEAGSDRARRYMLTCTYAETAPVPLDDYIESVAAQSLTLQHIGPRNLEAAFSDMLLEREMLDSLGPAVNAGRGMFLYGSPGNGKTSIAERVVRCYGNDLWIPRTIIVDGVCVRLFDPVLHQELASEDSSMLGEPLEDARWVRVRRPTVVVGGELTMEQLELRHDPVSNVSEAPLQMKSNCGVLLIDDFGRQSMPAAELLNRWIVPLEKRYDYQKLPTGKKIQVPFDQLVVFATNLAPRDLVDEAFLRRLPYKIEVSDPTREQFYRICDLVGPTIGIRTTRERVETLVDRYFESVGRPMRCCHPRDLLLQMRSYCSYHELPLEFSDEAMAFAVKNYFAVM